MTNFARQAIKLTALSLLTVTLYNCGHESLEQKAEPLVEERANISVDAMVIADPAPLIVPALPVVPVVAPLPVLPPPPVPLVLPGPEPFLNGTRTVPPEWANFVSSRGQLPSRHGNKTFLYSYEREVDFDDDHHKHD